ncbi:hypothetical protein [Methanoregula sp.]|uniref:hypothetical protein n=1 Tax=Methanoregula sp. TaxID=2052170 RepID=UPI00356A036F
MTIKRHTLLILIAVCLLVLVMPIQAAADTGDDQNVNVIYQTSFASDPRWTTNVPSTNYWEPGAGRYHFTIDPSTGGYAWVPVSFKDTSFKLDYDVMLTKMQDGSTFRLVFSSNEMNPEKGPAIVTKFTNGKYGQIMWLQVVTPSNKMVEVNSQSDVTAYKGSTVKYEINKTYHVAVVYDKEQNTITMKVREKESGQEIWGYFIKLTDELNGMSRLWIGSLGDYGGAYVSQGVIDNIQITTPGEVVTAVPTTAATISSVTAPVTPTKKVTAKTTVPTPYPTATQSPSSLLLPLAALGIIGGCMFLFQRKE